MNICLHKFFPCKFKEETMEGKANFKKQRDWYKVKSQRGRAELSIIVFRYKWNLLLDCFVWSDVSKYNVHGVKLIKQVLCGWLLKKVVVVVNHGSSLKFHRKSYNENWQWGKYFLKLVAYLGVFIGLLRVISNLLTCINLLPL